MGHIVDTYKILRRAGFAPSPPIVRLLERALGVTRFERLCAGAGVTAANADVRRQIGDVFAAADIRWEVTEVAGSIDRTRTGPLIFYSNHPYGFADALISLTIALGRRPDTKVLANSALAAFDFNTTATIWVDLGSGTERLATNRKSLREALRHLQAGGALLIFPSQVCSHLQLPECRVTDPPWSRHLVSLIDRSGATCVPLYFEGCNSWRFHLLGLIHPELRTFLLLREFVALSGRCIRVCVGAPVTARETAAAGASDADRLRELRGRVYALREAADARRSAPGLARPGAAL
jgi:putative hemolysin